MANATLIRVDRNGTKYYQGMVPCDRCGGVGGSDAWSYTGFTCYKCGGTGKMLGEWVERTPEYEAKLAEKRAKRAAKHEAELKARQLAEYDANCKTTLEENAFTPEGITYIFLGNTYSKREQIKELGGKYDWVLGWHISHKVEGFDFLTVKYEDVAGFTDWGKINFKATTAEIDNMKRAEEKRLRGGKESEYVGKIGDKVNLKATYEASASFQAPSFYGDMETRYIHTFRDADGNIFIWKTGRGLCFERGADVTIKGSIKDHTEYHGDKQTVLTRCRVN